MIPVVIGMIVFSVLHSLMAGGGIKQAFKKQFGERAYYGLYRLTYNIVAIVTLVPILVWVILYPGEVVWRIEAPWSTALLVLQLIGVIGVIVSILQISVGQFTGLSQLEALLRGKPLPLLTEPLQVKGLYRVVRHPLYLFSLLTVWPMGTMTTSFLILNIAITIYFVVGSIMEEKRLEAVFGQAYRDYKARVPWLIPTGRSFQKDSL